MALTNDASVIRSILETDRPWSIYALGDLAPRHFRHCEWHVVSRPAPALILLYRAFVPPVLFALGVPAALEVLLGELENIPEMYLHVRPDALPLIQRSFRIRAEKAMWRMILAPGQFRPAEFANVAFLSLADLPALQHLYLDGSAAGEAPDFFSPSMLEEGVYCGVWEARELIAAAGTHLFVPDEGVGAIGNVYTRRDRRGRGLARFATSAVAKELLRREVRTVALNVSQGNLPAIRVYERLGFVHYCDFREGLAVRA
jgi:GNAT superfamily N-acetyltransferase